MAISLTPSALGQMQTTSQPFVWGAGGRRLTPDQIERERQIAASLMQPDYSPVQHWTQGLARLSGNILGAFREKSADRAAERNAAESDRVLQALMNPGAAPGTPPMSPGGEVPAPGGAPINPAISAALANQYIDPSVRKLAMDQYTRATKRAEPIEINGQLIDPTTSKVLGDFRTAPEQPEIVRLANLANDLTQPEYVRKAAQDRITALNDPVVSIPLPGNRVALGPRSAIPSLLGGGGPASTAPGGAQPPATLPPDFDGFDKGGPTPTASGGFPRR
jgi:hypothetical protein